MDYRTVQHWLAWYRQGGLPEVLRHRHGGQQGRAKLLTAEQEKALLERASQGEIFTIAEARRWVEAQFGVRYTYFGKRSVFKRLHLKKKVPRPLADKASAEAQEAWKREA